MNNCRMHIWMLIWDYWPGLQGGAERQCRLISPHISKRGVNVTVVTARLSFFSKARENDGLVSICRIGIVVPLLIALSKFFVVGTNYLFGRKSRSEKKCKVPHDDLIFKLRFWSSLPFLWFARFYFMVAFSVKMFRNRKKLDLIHVHETGWLGAFAIFLGERFHIPVVCLEATYPPFPVIGWDVPFGWYLRRFQQQGSYVALNEQVKKEIASKIGQSGHVTVVPNAVLFPEERSIPAESKTVLYVGNFSQGGDLKGFDVLFKAWAEVKAQIFGCKLVLAGGGNNDTWKAMVQDLGCEESVVFKGFVSEPALLYQEAAMLVLPSRIEGMSNALLEAMSWGLPVLVSDIPGNRAVVMEGQNGMLVPAGDAKSLADAMVHLMSLPDLRAQMGSKGRLMVEKNCNIDTVASQLVKMYENLSFQTR